MTARHTVLLLYSPAKIRMARCVAQPATQGTFYFRIRFVQLESGLLFLNCWPYLLLIVRSTARPGSETNLTRLREEAIQPPSARQLRVAAQLFGCAGLACGVASRVARALDVW